MSYIAMFDEHRGTLPVWGEMAKEFSDAAGSLSRQEWLSILVQAAGEAGRETLRTKVQTVNNGARMAREIWRRYSDEGVATSLRTDAARIAAAVQQIPASLRTTVLDFLKLPREKKTEVVTVTVMTMIIFYATAGGGDFEGGLPDTDILLGMGNHRNIFFHSVLIGFGVEFSLRMATIFIRRFAGRLPSNHNPIWDEISDFIIRNQNMALAALWAGLGAHLMKDASLFGGATKPYTRLPGHHTMAFHKGLFAANAVASEAIAWDELRRKYITHRKEDT